MIEIWATIDWVLTPGHVIIKLNDQILFSDKLLTKKLQFNNIKFLKGENSLTVELVDKDDRNSTIVDSLGNIVKDTFVSIDNIIIDNFMLKNYKDILGTIHIDWNKNKGSYTYLNEKGIDVTTWCKEKPTYLSLNAVYELKFNWPLDTWLKTVKHVTDSRYVFEQIKVYDDKIIDEIKTLLKEDNDNISS